MITKPSKNHARKRVHSRVRKKISGNETRPRLNVYRSNKNINAQLIDDDKGVTVASASTNEQGFGEGPTGNVESAKQVGKLVAERAIEKGHKAVVFDRGGYLYHGRVKALADAAREAGLDF
ncbi:MAG TPA: 50S ribosomal protein L18 [Pseudogracilibacillus sp.]|nr:50S ribosomal protein L18 [Pseudogracilibacillus sp.]